MNYTPPWQKRGSKDSKATGGGRNKRKRTATADDDSENTYYCESGEEDGDEGDLEDDENDGEDEDLIASGLIALTQSAEKHLRTVRNKFCATIEIGFRFDVPF